MTTPATIPAEGTILKMKISAAFVEIALIDEIDGPAVIVAAVETTHLTSTLHTHRPSKLPKPDKLTGKMQFDPNDTAMHKLIADRVGVPGVVDDFEIDFIDANTTHAKCTFSGFFTSFKLPAIKVEQNLMADFEIQLTTIVTWSPGTP